MYGHHMRTNYYKNKRRLNATTTLWDKVQLDLNTTFTNYKSPNKPRLLLHNNKSCFQRRWSATLHCRDCLMTIYDSVGGKGWSF